MARLTNQRHPRRTPWVPNGTGQRCVGRYCVPEPHSLGCWQKWVMGKSAEAERRTLSSHGPENPEEKEIVLSLRKWVPLALRRLPGRFGAWLGRGGAGLLREARRAGLGVNSPWGRSSSGGRRRAPTVTGRLMPGPRGSGGRCITPGQDVLDRLGLLLYRRELLCKALDGVAEQPRLGDGGVKEACLVDVLHLCQVEPENTFPRDRAVTSVAHRAKSVTVHRSCVNPRSVLPSCTCLSALAW